MHAPLGTVERFPQTATDARKVANASGDKFDAASRASRARRSNKPKARRPTAGKAKKKGKWAAQSNALRQAMKANRDFERAKKAGVPIDQIPVANVPSMNEGFIPCPHCGRTFNEKAGKRHIARCKDIKAKPTFLKRKTGGMSSSAKGSKGRGGRGGGRRR